MHAMSNGFAVLLDMIHRFRVFVELTDALACMWSMWWSGSMHASNI